MHTKKLTTKNALIGKTSEMIETVKIIDCENINIIYAIRMLSPESLSNPEKTTISIYRLKLTPHSGILDAFVIEGVDYIFIFHPSGILKLTPEQMTCFVNIFSIK